jgi:hypothetical protein
VAPQGRDQRFDLAYHVFHVMGASGITGIAAAADTASEFWKSSDRIQNPRVAPGCGACQVRHPCMRFIPAQLNYFLLSPTAIRRRIFPERGE